jgi:hypothetical protein
MTESRVTCTCKDRRVRVEKITNIKKYKLEKVHEKDHWEYLGVDGIIHGHNLSERCHK